MRKHWFLGLCVISFFVSLYFIVKMPEVVPIHWNSQGQVDGYGSRWTYLISALLPVGTYLGMGVTRKIDPKQKQLNRNPQVYEFFRCLLSVFMIVMNSITILSVYNHRIDISLVMSLMIGLLMIIMGNYMPRIPQNYFLGVRFPWAIDNEYVWNKTQRMGGYCFVVSGLMMIICGVVKSEYLVWVALAVVILDVVAMAIYSYQIYKKVKDNE